MQATDNAAAPWTAAAVPAATATVAPRLLELDALRGLAALGILCLHTMPRWFFWAWSCVDLFFILSGFLITSILLANRDTPRMLWSFYVRRALRIWPVYYVALLATTLIFLVHGQVTTGGWPSVPGGHWLSVVFLQYTDRYLAAIPDLDYIWYFSHSWSLAEEEQFYLLWPVVFLFLRPRATTLYVAGAALLATAIFLRADGMYFYLLATRIDGLLFGILLAYAAASGALARIPLRVFAGCALAGLALLVPYVLSRGRFPIVGVADGRAVEVAAFCLLYAAVIGVAIQRAGAPFLALLRTRPLVHAGRISFAIYMYQVPLGYLALEAIAAGWVSRTAAHVALWIATLACAHASYLYLERPVLALKSRFPYRGPNIVR